MDSNPKLSSLKIEIQSVDVKKEIVEGMNSAKKSDTEAKPD